MSHNNDPDDALSSEASPWKEQEETQYLSDDKNQMVPLATAENPSPSDKSKFSKSIATLVKLFDREHLTTPNPLSAGPPLVHREQHRKQSLSNCDDLKEEPHYGAEGPRGETEDSSLPWEEAPQEVRIDLSHFKPSTVTVCPPGQLVQPFTGPQVAPLHSEPEDDLCPGTRTFFKSWKGKNSAANPSEMQNSINSRSESIGGHCSKPEVVELECWDDDDTEATCTKGPCAISVVNQESWTYRPDDSSRQQRGRGGGQQSYEVLSMMRGRWQSGVPGRGRWQSGVRGRGQWQSGGRGLGRWQSGVRGRGRWHSGVRGRGRWQSGGRVLVARNERFDNNWGRPGERCWDRPPYHNGNYTQQHRGSQYIRQQDRCHYRDGGRAHFHNTSGPQHPYSRHFNKGPGAATHHLQAGFRDEVDLFVTEVDGDLFTAPEDVSLAHCVAEDLRMGSGIAVAFRHIFKRVDELQDQRKGVGDVAILEEPHRFIYYLVTKKYSHGKPFPEDLVRSLKKMRDHILAGGVTKLAMPRIGCGLDRLDWKEVKSCIANLFRHTGVEITIYNFQQESAKRVPCLAQYPRNDQVFLRESEEPKRVPSSVPDSRSARHVPCLESSPNLSSVDGTLKDSPSNTWVSQCDQKARKHIPKPGWLPQIDQLFLREPKEWKKIPGRDQEDTTKVSRCDQHIPKSVRYPRIDRSFPRESKEREEIPGRVPDQCPNKDNPC